MHTSKAFGLEILQSRTLSERHEKARPEAFHMRDAYEELGGLGIHHVKSFDYSKSILSFGIKYIKAEVSLIPSLAPCDKGLRDSHGLCLSIILLDLVGLMIFDIFGAQLPAGLRYYWMTPVSSTSLLTNWSWWSFSG